MYAVSREDYDKHKSALFHHYVDPYHATSGIVEAEKTKTPRRIGGDTRNVQIQFINAYFQRFLRY